MVDPDLITYMQQNRRPWNKEVCEGLAKTEFRKIPELLNRVVRCSLDGAVPGLTFIDSVKVDPREQLAEEIRARNGKHTLEHTRMNLVMYRYNFSFNGTKFHKYHCLPFTDHDGLITMRDTRYQYSPVLTDRFFSVDKGLIFVPFTRVRITFHRSAYFFVANRKTVTADTYWANVHLVGKTDASPLNPQLLNYLMCWMGATDAFKFLGYDVLFGDHDMFNEVDFPRDEWVICQTTGIRPRARIANYVPPHVCIAVRKADYDRKFECFAASFFYILDSTAGHIDFAVDHMDHPLAWKRALCRFIWKNPDLLETVKEVENHINSLDEYLDEIIRRKLQVEQIYVDNIAEFFRHLMINFSEIVMYNDPAAVVGKKLSVLESACLSSIKMINTVMFELKRVAPDRLHEKTVIDIFNRGFKPMEFTKLTTAQHPECAVAESATDCLPYKLTSVMVRASRSTGSQTGQASDPAQLMHPDFISIHSARLVTKSTPPATGRINPNVLLSPTGEVMEDPVLVPYKEELRRLL